jgi:nucleoside-diphosphate-sugar epimerase
MKTVLITGATGLVGSILAKQLAARGFAVLAPTRHELDLACAVSTERYLSQLESVDVLVHCAASAHGGNLYSSREVRLYNSKLFHNAMLGTDRFMPRTILFSSVAVYENDSGVTLLDNLAPACSSEYGLGKLDDEERLIKSGRSFCIVRLAPFYTKRNYRDVGSRFYLIPDTLKLKIMPAPVFQFCGEQTLISAIDSLVVDKRSFITLLCDEGNGNNIFDELPGAVVWFPRSLAKLLVRLFRKILSGEAASKFGKALDPIYIEKFCVYIDVSESEKRFK